MITDKADVNSDVLTLVSDERSYEIYEIVIAMMAKGHSAAQVVKNVFNREDFTDNDRAVGATLVGAMMSPFPIMKPVMIMYSRAMDTITKQKLFIRIATSFAIGFAAGFVTLLFR